MDSVSVWGFFVSRIPKVKSVLHLIQGQSKTHQPPPLAFIYPNTPPKMELAFVDYSSFYSSEKEKKKIQKQGLIK